jgi:hypothetical protein
VKLAIALVMLAACAPAHSPSSPGPPPPPDAAIAPPPPDAVIAPPPPDAVIAPPPPVGYRGRLLVPARPGLPSTAITWIDVEVLGNSDGQRAACEAAIASETGAFAAPGTRVERPCDLAPLPGPPSGTVVLVDSVTADGVRVATSTPLESAATCELARERLVAIHRLDAEAPSAGSQWLAAERDSTRTDRDRSCQEAAADERRCARTRGQRAKEMCSLEQSSSRRRCESDTRKLAIIEERLARPPPPPPVRAVECRRL